MGWEAIAGISSICTVAGGIVGWRLNSTDKTIRSALSDFENTLIRRLNGEYVRKGECSLVVEETKRRLSEVERKLP